MAVGVSWPYDRKFEIDDRQGFHMVMINGQRFLEADFTVTEFEEPYPGFYGWLY